MGPLQDHEGLESSQVFCSRTGGTSPNPAQLEVPNKSVATALSVAEALPGSVTRGGSFFECWATFKTVILWMETIPYQLIDGLIIRI